jgi:hypothetical protein
MRNIHQVIHKCDCGCSMLVVEKEIFDDGDIIYGISIQDSRYDHNNPTVWNRIKSAMKLLFGKPVYYSDIFIEKEEDFTSLVSQLQELCKKS